MKCPKCETECISENGLKKHLTRSHGGWVDADLVKAGIKKTAGSDVARSIASGHRSAEEVAGAAPATDTAKPEEAGTGIPKKRRTSEDAEKEAKRKLAREKLGGILCRKASRGPYLITASMLKDERWLLLKAEEDEMVDAMTMFVEAFDVDMSSKWFAALALLAVHSDALAMRIPLLFEQQQVSDAERPTEVFH